MKPLSAALITASFLSAASALPGADVYFGEDVSEYPEGPNTVPVPDYTNSQRVAAEFLARVPGGVTESFEGLATGSAPTAL